MSCACGFPDYNNFRTGYNFKSVRKMLSHEQKQKYLKGLYMFITRATVLGRWHQIKIEMYNREEKLHNKFCKE
jgi:hypothetical protein